MGWSRSPRRTLKGGEYGYTERKTGVKVNTNTVEGYYSIFKRGMKGVYQHCSENHLHRYVAEFDFRYSNRSALGQSALKISLASG